MQDCHGRTIDYIRISVTDRCNLRCVYCMPEQEDCIQKEQLLSHEELVGLCRHFAKLGIKKIKITGGEPLVRRDLPELISKLKAVPGIEIITLTTNGVLLKEQLPALVRAGINAVNISMDSLDENGYEQISRKRELHKTLEGLEAALEYPELTVKINCVPLKGVNDQELAKIASLARDRKLHVRFIEMMPIGYGKQFTFQGEEEIKHLLEEQLQVSFVPYEEKLGNGPCHYYKAEGFQGKIGFISAMSHKFCDSCNRIRLTCDGFLKSCLQYNIGCDLKALLRENASEQQIAAAIRETIYNKPLCHQFEEHNGISEEELRKMSQIGG